MVYLISFDFTCLILDINLFFLMALPISNRFNDLCGKCLAAMTMLCCLDDRCALFFFLCGRIDQFGFSMHLIVIGLCHARVHGLIHDGWLWACKSCL
jgi:hypothetical protein